MNTGPLGIVAALWKMRNYIFGGGPKGKRKAENIEGLKAPDDALPKRRYDPDLDNYIFGGGPKRKRKSENIEGLKAPEGALPKPRHDPEMDNYLPI